MHLIRLSYLTLSLSLRNQVAPVDRFARRDLKSSFLPRSRSVRLRCSLRLLTDRHCRFSSLLYLRFPNHQFPTRIGCPCCSLGYSGCSIRPLIRPIPCSVRFPVTRFPVTRSPFLVALDSRDCRHLRSRRTHYYRWVLSLRIRFRYPAFHHFGLALCLSLPYHFRMLRRKSHLGRRRCSRYRSSNPLP